MKRIDLTGQRFGRLLVLNEFDRKSCQIRWMCKCDCGNKTVVFGSNLKKEKHSNSCGCLGKEILLKISKDGHTRTHGLTNSKSYRSWRAMKDRCSNKKHPAYQRYSNIKIDEKWLIFQNFYDDMGDRPIGKTLDRIDNLKGYYKENCRWATYKEQGMNRCDNRILEFNGKSMTIMEWSEKLKINYSTLSMRINNSKWSVEKALTTPVRIRK
jgi:hypothetical protein